MKSALTVLLSPPGPLRSVAGVLQDWSALGLVDDFVWCEASNPSGHDTSATMIKAGARHTSTLRNLAADLNPSAVLLCVLVPYWSGIDVVPVEQEEWTAQLLDSVAPSGYAARVRCVVVRLEDEGNWGDGQVAREGWHNIVLAPEDRAAPSSASVLLGPPTDPTELGMHAGLGIAGALGLWAGVDPPAPLGQPTPGRTARIVRAYYRNVSAHGVEAELCRSVTSMSHGLPIPREHGVPAEYVTDVDHATTAMADAWWHKHATTLRTPRERVEHQPAKPIGALEAIHMFLSFLLASLRNVPGAWYSTAIRRASQGLASRVHKAVFGSGSAYTVVVNGITPDGTPADWLQTAKASEEVDTALGPDATSDRDEGYPDLAALWQDFTAGAITLADGETRNESLPAARFGSAVAVVRNVDAIVPTDHCTFREISGPLAARLLARELPAYDVLRSEHLQRKLSALAAEPALGLDVDRARQQLRDWYQQIRHSYAVRVGEHLGQAILETKHEIVELLASIRDSSGGEPAGAEVAAQHKLAKKMQLILIALVCVLIALAVFTGFGIIAVLVGAGVGVAAVSVGIFGLARTFYRGQRDLFRLLNRRVSPEGDDAVTVRNLRAALRDMRRLSGAYGQYLAWCQVLSSFLSQPFGQSATRPGLAGELEAILPRGLRLGLVEADQRAIETVAADMRRDLFTIGWLGRRWSMLIDDVPRRLGAATPTKVINNPHMVFGLPALQLAGEISPLRRWVDTLVTEGPFPDPDNEQWKTAFARLRDSHSSSYIALLNRIRSVARGPDGPVSLEKFLAGVEESAKDHRGNSFDTSILTPTATVGDAGAVTNVNISSGADGLSFRVTMTELSDEIPARDFALAPADAPEAIFGPEPEFIIPAMPGLVSHRGLPAGSELGWNSGTESVAATSKHARASETS